MNGIYKNEFKKEISYDPYIPICVPRCEKHLYRIGNIKSTRRVQPFE